MVGWMFLGLTLLVGGVLAVRWYTTAAPRDLLRVLKWAVVVLGLVLVAVLVLRGGLNWAFAAIPLLMPFLIRLPRLLRQAKTFQRMAGAPSGETSVLETRFLRMTLDVETGAMDGVVLDGDYSGRVLSALGMDDLRSLLAYCRAEDPDSARVLEAYLDRMRGGVGDDAADGGDHPGGFGVDMDRREAARILGIDPQAATEEVKAAHHRLIAAVHPDRGGSDFLAAKINQAKDVLLAGRSGKEKR